MQQIQRALAGADPKAMVRQAPPQPPLSFVADICGCPAAALVLQPAAAAPPSTEQRRRLQARQGAGAPSALLELQVVFAAVFPEMDQSAEVVAALASYALLQLMVANRPVEVQQGNLLLLPAMQRQAGKRGSAAAHLEPPASGAPTAVLLHTHLEPATMAATSARAAMQWQHSTLEFAPGGSLDLLAASVAADMVDLATPALAAAPSAPAPAPLPLPLSTSSTVGNPGSEQAPAAADPEACRLSLSGALPDSLAAETGEEGDEEGGEHLDGSVAAVVIGFMEAAGFSSEQTGCQRILVR